MLGLCIALMFLGGLSLDLWRAVADRRELSSMADAAATAGANGVDVEALRAGTLRLDPGARPRDRAGITRRGRAQSHARHVDVEVVGNRVTVTLRDHVRFSLLGIFMGGRHFDVEAHASAEPRERS